MVWTILLGLGAVVDWLRASKLSFNLRNMEMLWLIGSCAQKTGIPTAAILGKA